MKQLCYMKVCGDPDNKNVLTHRIYRSKDGNCCVFEHLAPKGRVERLQQCDWTGSTWEMTMDSPVDMVGMADAKSALDDLIDAAIEGKPQPQHAKNNEAHGWETDEEMDWGEGLEWSDVEDE